jgi:hypothetical protein
MVKQALDEYAHTLLGEFYAKDFLVDGQAVREGQHSHNEIGGFQT